MVRSHSADEMQHEDAMDDKLDVEDEDEELDIEGDRESDAANLLMLRSGMQHNSRKWSATQRMLDGSGSASVSPTGMDKTGNADIDRRIRRQIANCNERRRMQSINAGFQSLRALLPRKEGEKLSKAAILQQTAELIQTLRSEMTRILEKSACSEEDTTSVGANPSNVWKKPRLERESDSSMDSSSAALEQSLMDVRNQLEKERVMRLYYENKLRAINSASSTPTSTPLSPVLAALPLFAGTQQHMRMQQGQGAQPTPPQPNESSVIRPTPTQPLRVDVTLANLVSSMSNAAAVVAHQQQQQQSAGVGTVGSRCTPPLPSTPHSATLSHPSTLPSHPSHPPPPSALANRSLNVILEAIRHLEGNPFGASSPSPPTASSHSNLLVR